MKEVIGGIAIPDSSLARNASEHARDAMDDLLFDHSRRVFVFGALQSERHGISVDLELLYVGALFHDIGLTQAYSTSSNRFEVDSANAAAAFLQDNGRSPEDMRRVWLSIALHTSFGIPQHLDGEIALLASGVGTDVLGIELDALDSATVADIVSQLPRPNFKERILEAFNAGNLNRPETTFGNPNADILAHFDPAFVKTNIVDLILDSPWPTESSRI
jgi:hypothetical protein